MAKRRKNKSRTRRDRDRVLHVRRKRTVRRPPAPTVRQQRQDNRAAGALRRMREGESLGSASRAEGTSPRAVRKYAGKSISRRKGKYIYNPRKDKALRHFSVITPTGDTHGDVSRSDASKMSRYKTALSLFLSKNKKKHAEGQRLLREFKGKKFRVRGADGKWKTHKFVTDKKKIERLFKQGLLNLKERYVESKR